MASPFVAEIRIFGFNFAPTGWALCDGQLMPISQNTALFSLLGTMYGGDGKSTFALPNLQGSAPMQQGQGSGLSQRFQGETGGEENVTLLTTEMPSHSHSANAFSGGGSATDPTDNVWASAQVLRQGQNLYGPAGGATMNPLALSIAGSSFPHNNLMPYLVLNFCIALQGVFPARS
jgi:microcystin-dependent protein